jgi:hypothetical protein
VRPHFQPARMGLEGLVSKLRDSRYRAGPSRDWIKVKNPTSSAMSRAKDLASQKAFFKPTRPGTLLALPNGPVPSLGAVEIP